MRRLLLSIIAILSCSLLYADDMGVWQYFNISKKLGKGFSATLRLEHRSRNNASDLEVALVMPGISYTPVKWLSTGFYYDFAMTKGGNRHVLLPFVQASANLGPCNLSVREMGQYNATANTFILRSRLKLSCAIPGACATPYTFVEFYSSNRLDRVHFLSGLSFRASDITNVELGYGIYYLGATLPLRHLLNIGVLIAIP